MKSYRVWTANSGVIVINAKTINIIYAEHDSYLNDKPIKIIFIDNKDHIIAEFYCDMISGWAELECIADAVWIPVEERPPKENETVIASTLHGVYPEARYTKENGWEWAYESGADYWVELEYVTAWMPIPKPYKEKEE